MKSWCWEHVKALTSRHVQQGCKWWDVHGLRPRVLLFSPRRDWDWDFSNFSWDWDETETFDFGSETEIETFVAETETFFQTLYKMHSMCFKVTTRLASLLIYSFNDFYVMFCSVSQGLLRWFPFFCPRLFHFIILQSAKFVHSLMSSINFLWF